MGTGGKDGGNSDGIVVDDVKGGLGRDGRCFESCLVGEWLDGKSEGLHGLPPAAGALTGPATPTCSAYYHISPCTSPTGGTAIFSSTGTYHQ